MVIRQRDVWWATLAQYRPDHLDLLGEVERERRDRFHREEDQVRFTLGVAVLRRAVASTLGVSVADVAIDRTCPTCDQPHGRPRLPGGELHLSVSHSGAWVAVALSPVAPVGIDVERLKRDMAAPEIDQMLKANHQLAAALDINGTPGFVIGDEVVPSAVGIDTLRQLIATARSEKAK